MYVNANLARARLPLPTRVTNSNSRFQSLKGATTHRAATDWSYELLQAILLVPRSIVVQRNGTPIYSQMSSALMMVWFGFITWEALAR